MRLLLGVSAALPSSPWELDGNRHVVNPLCCRINKEGGLIRHEAALHPLVPMWKGGRIELARTRR